MFRKPPVELLAMTERAVTAEAETALLRAALDTATQHLDGIELRFANRATLVSIAREGRVLKFTFLRNNQIFVIKCIGTWDDDVNQWKKDLFE